MTTPINIEVSDTTDELQLYDVSYFVATGTDVIELRCASEYFLYTVDVNSVLFEIFRVQ